MSIEKKIFRRQRIRYRIRKIVKGSPEAPRLSVFRSNKHISAQIIDDQTGKTLTQASSICKEISEKKITKIEQAKLVGKLLAEKAIDAGITTIVFDRGGYLYHGRVKSLAEATRKNGIKF